MELIYDHQSIERLIVGAYVFAMFILIMFLWNKE